MELKRPALTPGTAYSVLFEMRRKKHRRFAGRNAMLKLSWLKAPVLRFAPLAAR
jgi:hypothetical protein